MTVWASGSQRSPRVVEGRAARLENAGYPFATIEDAAASSVGHDKITIIDTGAVLVNSGSGGAPTTPGNEYSDLAAGVFCNAGGYIYGLAPWMPIYPEIFGLDMTLFLQYAQRSGLQVRVNNGTYTAAAITLNDTAGPRQLIAGNGKIQHALDDTAVLFFQDDGAERLQSPGVRDFSMAGTGAVTTDDYAALMLWGTDHGRVFDLDIDYKGTGVSFKYGAASLGPYAGSPSLAVGWEDQPLRLGRGNKLLCSRIKADIMGVESFSQLAPLYVGNFIESDGAAGTLHAFRITGYPGMPHAHGRHIGNYCENMQNGYSIQSSSEYNTVIAAAIKDVTNYGFQLQNVTYTDKGLNYNYFQGIVENAALGGAFLAKPGNSRFDLICDGGASGVTFTNSGTYLGKNAWNIADYIVNGATSSSDGSGAYIGTDYSHHRVVVSECDASGATPVRIVGNYNIVDVIIDEITTVGKVQILLQGNGNIVRFVGAPSVGASISVFGDSNDITANCDEVTFAAAANSNTLRGNVGLVSGGGLGANNIQVGERAAATAAVIASVSSIVNTAAKYPGRTIFDTTNNRVMVASGTAAADPWYVSDGSASVVPA